MELDRSTHLGRKVLGLGCVCLGMMLLCFLLSLGFLSVIFLVSFSDAWDPGYRTQPCPEKYIYPAQVLAIHYENGSAFFELSVEIEIEDFTEFYSWMLDADLRSHYREDEWIAVYQTCCFTKEDPPTASCWEQKEKYQLKPTTYKKQHSVRWLELVLWILLLCVVVLSAGGCGLLCYFQIHLCVESQDGSVETIRTTEEKDLWEDFSEDAQELSEIERKNSDDSDSLESVTL